MIVDRSKCDLFKGVEKWEEEFGKWVFKDFLK